MAICNLKSNKNFIKNGILKFCHSAFPDAPLLPCSFKRNQYGSNSFCRESLKQHFYQIILESDEQITEEREFKVWVFFSLSDAFKVLHRM